MNERIGRILQSERVLWCVMAIVFALAVFFRIYHFHDWLHFGNDQARDAVLVENVVNHKAPWPLLGSSMGNTGFLLGPAYYYFQIVSVKLFGIGPEKLAYPDLVFNLLSIPLLFLFLRKYFNKGISLSLTGLYGLSYYAIEYSRFAWNPNPIPFFVILFLWPLWEFFSSEEKTGWPWIIALGIALGIGSQLHAILLLTMVGTLGASFIFLMKRNWKTWSRWIVVAAIAIVANTGQIIHEQQTNYANTKVFLNSFSDKQDNSGGKRFLRNLELNIACNAQANTLIAASLGNKENCDFLYAKARNTRPGAKLQLPSNILSLLGIVCSVLFSVLGYGLLAWRTWKERERARKYFTGIILLYAVVSFSVMLPIIDQAPMRYFIHVTFLPFVFLGLIIDVLKRRHPRHYALPALLLLAVLSVTNLFSIFGEAKVLADKTRGDSGYLVLDETQLLADFIVEQSVGRKTAYLFGGTRYYSPYNKALIYLAAERGLTLKRGTDIGAVPADAPAFYVSASFGDGAVREVGGMPFTDHRDVGQVGIYRIH
ncbi:MAG: glycosyltransferase family 39 protein [Candidatus Moraniibacteriota bacterium]